MNVNDAMETAAAYWAAHEQEQEPLFDSEEVAITLAAEVERLRAELAAAKDQFVNDCIKHINKVALLNDCEFEGGMIADSIKEYFRDRN